MSIWYNIKDREDVDFDYKQESIDILFKTNYDGAEYVSVPLVFIIEELEKHNYKITYKDD